MRASFGNSSRSTQVQCSLLVLALVQTHARGVRKTSRSWPSSDEASLPTSGMYSHRAVSGKLIKMLSIRADGVANPNFVPRS